MKKKLPQLRCQRCGLSCTLLTSETIKVDNSWYRICHRASHSCWVEVMVMGRPFENGAVVNEVSPAQLVIPGMEHLAA